MMLTLLNWLVSGLLVIVFWPVILAAYLGVSRDIFFLACILNFIWIIFVMIGVSKL